MGSSHVIPELLRKAHEAPEGGRLEVYSVDHTRTFCYVDDAISLMVRLAELAEAGGQTFNVGNQEPEITIGELARMILGVVGKELVIVPLQPTPGSPIRRCPDLSRLNAQLGSGSRVSLQEGVRRTYEWYRNNAFNPHQSSTRAQEPHG